MPTSIKEYRKRFSYRILESVLGVSTLTFFLILTLLAIFLPVLLAVFLIGYSFLTVLRTGLHAVYTIYTYQYLHRWEKLNWKVLLDEMETDPEKALDTLHKFERKYQQKIDWHKRIQEDMARFHDIQNTKFAKPGRIFHFPIFAVYNEAPEIIARSLKNIFDSGYDLEKVFVFISQEARAGEENNLRLKEYLESQSWLNVYQSLETDLEKVYSPNHNELDYQNPEFTKITSKKAKLTVVLTQHPDGLEGEIRGKASNEDWGGRQASLFVKANNLDPEMVVLTSLDSDSKIGPYFLQMLSYRYCLSEDRSKAGFQPLPVYANNFFQSNLFPRIVATNTTIWYMVQASLLDELHFFANYAVPLTVLRKIDFWNREVIAEDSLLFAKCYVGFAGDFRVIPFYGTFEGDAVEGEDYLEAIINQYKQLQRWAWGGIEGFPYKFQKFFLEEEGKKIPLKKRLKMIRLEFLGHFFWATLPLTFSVFIFLPQMFGSQQYRESAVQLNLWIFGQYFTWISFVYLIISSYITFAFIARKATKNIKDRWYHRIVVSLQWVVSPAIFIMMSPPALDVQIRGILGKYLGYWVTPKKD
jgi:hypothetical protein